MSGFGLCRPQWLSLFTWCLENCGNRRGGAGSDLHPYGHPVWNFWWVESKLWRRLAAVAVLILLLLKFGQVSWPPESEALGPAMSRLLWKYHVWWSGPHGRWFERATGAFWTVVILGTAMVLKRLMLVLPSRALGSKGFLENKLDAENAIPRITVCMAKFAAIMQEVGRSLEKHGEALMRSQPSTYRQLLVSRAAASSLDGYSARFRRVSFGYIKQGDLFSRGLEGWFKWIERSSPDMAGFALFRER